MTMTPYLTRYYPLGARRPHTEVMYVDHLGQHVPLLDENGDKAVAAPLKSSLFGKEVGYDGLERHKCSE